MAHFFLRNAQEHSRRRSAQCLSMQTVFVSGALFEIFQLLGFKFIIFLHLFGGNGNGINIINDVRFHGVSTF